MSKQEKRQAEAAENRETASQLSRRDFLKMGIGALSALAIMEVAGASLLFMQPRGPAGGFGAVVNAGPVDSFPAGSVVQFPEAHFFLVRAADGGFLAPYQRCTHLGCSVAWEPEQGRFFCPCHASSFDIHGDVENPPAPRALDTFPVRIQEGQVLVDTGQSRTRDAFSIDQLVYA